MDKNQRSLLKTGFCRGGFVESNYQHEVILC